MKGNSINNNKGKVALLVGASGLIGQHLLSRLLAADDYAQVIILVRTQNKIQHKKLQQYVVNFQQLEQELDKLTANEKLFIPEHVFCVLGTTIKKAGSKKAFKQVDYSYPVTIARYFRRRNTSLFAIVSAMAADKSSRVFYNQVKGQVESDLMALNFASLGIFRPSLLTGERQEFRFAERLGAILMKVFARLIAKKYRAIPAEKVANAMLAFAKNPGQGRCIIESDQLQNH